jgi:type 1 glutamine amidotransferase
MKTTCAVLFAIGLLCPASIHAGDKAKALRVCLVSGSIEYDSDKSLDKLQKDLEKHFLIECSRAFIKTESDLPGLENLDRCDVMLLYTRRLKITGEQLERVKKYCLSGKPIVGIRTASHAFQNWLDLDKEVLGGNYKGHYKEGPLCEVALVDKAHPILKGVQPFKSVGSLYRNTGHAKDINILLQGSIPGETEPIAWTRNYKGGRIFYTSLGHQKDFDDPNFVTLVTNALYWTTNREPVVRKTP